MTLAPYEALKVRHLKGLNDHQRAFLAIGSYGRERNAQAASSRMSAFGDKAGGCVTGRSGDGLSAKLAFLVDAALAARQPEPLKKVGLDAPPRTRLHRGWRSTVGPLA
jgi:hypothetical protein